MIRCNANLFRIATACQSKEETRYYICGVFVEPHRERGVTLTATDGHRMLSIHDESGFADESAIISLGADGIKHCKSSKRGERRDVLIATGANDATICETAADKDGALTDTPLAMAYKVRIDGTFPAYRNVVPKTFTKNAAPSFAGIYLASMGNVGADLAMHFTSWTARDGGPLRKDGMVLMAEDCDRPESAPALVVWPSIVQAFGVLMPINKDGDEFGLPDWYVEPKAESVAA